MSVTVRGAWLALVLAVSARAPSSTPPPAARATSGTNIVLIAADDLGYGDVSFLGGDILTPHIDALAREGLQTGAAT